MKRKLRIIIISVGILLAAVVFLLLVVFPPDRLGLDPAFPELTGPYLGQDPPGRTPKRFAPEIIDCEVHTAAVFSPDGKEVYWRYISGDVDEILFMRQENGKWTQPEVVPFASRFFDSGDPFLSPDGEKLFFTTWRPVRWHQVLNLTEGIWFVERTLQGWSSPKPVGASINGMNLHWQFSVAENGSLYFTSEGDIYRSAYQNGQYQEPVRLGEAVNTSSHEGHPYIAPDERYLIFSSNTQRDSQGDYDLFLSTQRDDRSWSQAVNLGGSVNSRHQDLYPVVSPDEMYLFFISNREGMHSIYWVDFEGVRALIAGSSELD